MLRKRADLHLHSYYSDGVQSPTDVIRTAERMGLGAIALTDHDTIDGLHEFMTVEASEQLRRVPGVEISTEIDGREAHILGYFIPENLIGLPKRLEELASAREKRLPRIIKKLDSLGYQISQEEIQETLGEASSPGRPHVARLLLEKGFVNSIEEAFQEFLGVGKPAYVKKERMNTKEAIRLLREEGAVPILAHPLTVPDIDLKALFEDLKEAGLEGVEAQYNYSHLDIKGTNEDIRNAAAGFDFIFTGGSDSHGETSHGRMADVTVPITVTDELYEAARRIRTSGGRRRSNAS